jgi:hypothetical protein
MAYDPYKQYFDGPAKTGLRRLRAGGPKEAAFALALIYASIGASLGILFGATLAIKVFPADRPVATSSLAQSSASVAGFSGPLASIAYQAPTPANPVNQPVSVATPTLQKAVARTVAIDLGQAQTSTTVQTHHGPHRVSAEPETASLGRDFSEGPTARVTQVGSTVAASIEQPNVSATAEATAVTPTFMIEGDATVVDFDATTGLIETRDGKNFSIGTETAADDAITWQDYVGHVHYRCDPSGNCSLSRHGVFVPDARLIPLKKEDADREP